MEKFLAFVLALLMPTLVHAAVGTLPITVTAPGTFTAATLTMTNGPPNLPNASPCTTITCSWIPSNAPSGSHVSLVYADPTSFGLFSNPVYYTGTFALSDQAGHSGDSSHFSIATSADSVGRSVGEIKTSGSLTAQDYFITITASGASGTSSLNVTVHSATCNATPSPGSNTIPGSGGTICLSPGNYNLSGSLSPANGTIYVGIGNGATNVIGQAGSGDSWAFINSNGNIAQIGLTFQTSGGVGGDSGTVARNNRVVNSSINSSGMNAGGTGDAWYINNYVGGGGGSNGFYAAGNPSGGMKHLWGNEITLTNHQGHFDACVGGASLYIVSGDGFDMKYNYIHDNETHIIHFDSLGTGGGNYNFTGNTAIFNGASVFKEVSANVFDNGFNVYRDNGNRMTPLWFACGGGNITDNIARITQSVSSSDGPNHNLHDNNFSTGDGPTGDPDMLWIADTENCGTPNPGRADHITVHNNTVNFRTSNPNAQWVFNNDTGGGCTFDSTGSFSNNNIFNFVNGASQNDARFQWFNFSGSVSFPTYRSTSSPPQDAGSTVGSTDQSAAGCTHIACSGNPVGAGGMP